MLTPAELAFLKSQNLSSADVYDGRDQSTAVWKVAVRAAGLKVVLGAPCEKYGHRIRTRSGHCAQCRTSNLAYQQRHHSPGYVYVAGSRSARLIKIGTTTDVDTRSRALRQGAYGGISDWVILFHAKVDNGGEIEGIALRLLKRFQIVRTYSKDGSPQAAAELLNTSFPQAIKAIADAIGQSDRKDVWRSPD